MSPQDLVLRPAAQKRPEKLIRPQLSTAKRERDRRAGGSEPPTRTWLWGLPLLPSPRQRPSPWQPPGHGQRPRAPPSGSTPGSPYTGGTEGEAKEGKGVEC